MRILWLLTCAVGLLAPVSDSTIATLAAAIPASVIAAAPAIAAVGGLSAIKILKLVGLSKLKRTLADDDSYDSYDSYDYEDPYYSRPSRPHHYGPPPLYRGPPPFYIVPSNYYDHYSRGKREIRNPEVPFPIAEKPTEVIQMKDYFNVIGTLDTDGCVLRLVCELSGIPEEELKEDERIIMSLFDTSEVMTSTSIRTPKGIYDYAAWIGKNSASNPDACGTIYNRCGSKAQNIMEAFRHMEAEEISYEIKEVSQEV